MLDEYSNQLIGMIKTLIKDSGNPKSAEEIVDPEFRALAMAHREEFEEARAEFEAELTIA